MKDCHSHCLNAGPLGANWTANPNLQKLAFANISMPANTPLPDAWATSSGLNWIELDNVTGIVGGLPASWSTGLPALTVLIINRMPWLTTTLADYCAFINQGNRSSSFDGIGLMGMGLKGTIPPALFGATKWVLQLGMHAHCMRLDWRAICGAVDCQRHAVQAACLTAAFHHTASD